jgi:dTDP-4-amino-4,6-dideoxygalactose transaminase
MSEIAGAIMLAQLDRLDPMLAAMRKNHKRIAEQIKDIKGIKLRGSHDPEGDTGICLMFMLDSEGKAAEFAEALKAEGVAAEKYFDMNIPDWHMFPHFTHIIEKKSASKEGCPWTCPYHKGTPVEYSKDMNPNTIDYLSRSVHLHVMPQMTDEDCDMVADAINKVARVLL